jgi:hypothetical protein
MFIYFPLTQSLDWKTRGSLSQVAMKKTTMIVPQARMSGTARLNMEKLTCGTACSVSGGSAPMIITSFKTKTDFDLAIGVIKLRS